MDMGTELLRQALRLGNEMALYYKKNQNLYQTFHRLFAYFKFFVGQLEAYGYIWKMLETGQSTLPVAKMMLRPCAFKMQLYTHAIMSFEDCG